MIIPICFIRYDGKDYRVPGPSGQEMESRYTERRETALKIAKAVYGDSVVIRFIHVADSDPTMAARSRT